MNHPDDFIGLGPGYARIGDLDVAYLECRGTAGRNYHWYLAAGDSGVAFARPVAEGPLVPGEPSASRESIVARLAAIAAEQPHTSDADVLLAFEQGFRTKARPYPPAEVLSGIGIALDERLLEDMPHHTWKTWAPVGRRLRPHISLIATYEATEPSPYGTPGLTIGQATARALRLNPAERRTLSTRAHYPPRHGPRDSHHPLLKPLLELSGVDLEGSPAEVVARLMAELGVPAAAARRLPEGRMPSLDLIRAMRSVPVDWVPTTGNGAAWDAMERIADTLARHWGTESDWPTLLAGCKGDWAAFEERCLDAHQGPRAPDWLRAQAVIPLAVRHAHHVVEAFGSFLESLGEDTDASRALTSAVSAEATMGGLALPSILERSRVWHRRFRARSRSGIEWPALLPAWTDPSTGIEVVPLARSEDLVEEGAAMDHCVGGEAYALACLRDRVRILSLRRGEDRLSTAEVALDGDVHRCVMQHMGRSNGPVGPEAETALEAYLALPEVERSRTSAEAREAGLPPRTEAESEAMLEDWRPFLTGRWKRVSLAEFREAVSPRADAPDPDAGGPAP